MSSPACPAALLLATTLALCAAEPPEPKFRAFTVDDKIQIGYGVAVADVDGDGRPDILLADQRQIVWYKNPGQPPPGAESFAPPIWSKFVIAENLTEHDNVCLAAQDLDGDGKCELAVGADWNPSDTEHSGAVFYLIPPEDRQQRWTPVKFPSVEPTTHRMRWVKVEGVMWGLVVLPLHGRGNKNGEGAPVKVLLYHPPVGWPGGFPAFVGTDVEISPKGGGEWKSEVIDESMHMTHSFFRSPTDFCGREGIGGVTSPERRIWRHQWWFAGPLARAVPGYKRGHLERVYEPESFVGAGQASAGLAGSYGEGREPWGFVVTIEPMHGDSLVVYQIQSGFYVPPIITRKILTDKLTEGHALACGDLLGVKSDQIVVGWRGNPAKPDNTFGIHLWTPLDEKGENWRDSAVDDGGMACEDLVLADLNADGKLDIIASGRATKNVKIYWNETGR